MVLLASTHTFVAQVVRVGVRVLYGSNFVVRVKLYPCTPRTVHRGHHRFNITMGAPLLGGPVVDYNLDVAAKTTTEKTKFTKKKGKAQIRLSRSELQST